MLLIHILFLYGLTFLIGYFLTLFFRFSLLERLGLSCFLGSGWLTFWLFVCSCLLSTPFTQTLVTQILLVSAGGLGLIQFGLGKLQLEKPRLQFPHLSFSVLEKTIVCSLIVIVLFTVIQNAIWPITDWDAIAFYDFRAKVTVQTGFIQSGQELGYFFGYPPYTSFLHAASYVFEVPQAKLWYSWIYASFLIVFFAVLRKRVGRQKALIGVLVVATQPLLFDHATIAYTNLAYSAYLVLAILYLWQWWESGKAHELLLGALLLGLSTWVRLAEPFWMIGVLIIIANIWRRKKQVLPGLGTLALIWATKSLWPIYISKFDTPAPVSVQSMSNLKPTVNSTSWLQGLYQKLILLFPGIVTFQNYLHALTESPQILLAHLWSVGVYFVATILPVFGWILVPAIIDCSEDVRKRSTQRAYQWLTIGILIGMILVGTYIFSFTFETWDQIGGSAERMSMFLPSLIVFVIMQSELWQLLLKRKK